MVWVSLQEWSLCHQYQPAFCDSSCIKKNTAQIQSRVSGGGVCVCTAWKHLSLKHVGILGVGISMADTVPMGERWMVAHHTTCYLETMAVPYNGIHARTHAHTFHAHPHTKWTNAAPHQRFHVTQSRVRVVDTWINGSRLG